jgi:phospholipid/cholesterol/gamma-HCH transport system substrate-binding protein
MQKRAPTLANILVILLFALSCFGLLLFLWESFGGPVPLKPKGYRVSISFPRTLALAEQADVRISGVTVGHTISLKAQPNGRTQVVIEVGSQFAPLHRTDRVILRQKTLLGETYVQILPGPRSSAVLPDGAQVSDANVEPVVTLDDILSVFSPEVRHAFQVWMQSLAVGVKNQGEAINASFAELNPFVEHANRLVTLLAAQEGALRGVVRGTGEVFDALTAREGDLRGLITNGEVTFKALAHSSQDFAQTFREFPAFERSSITAFRSLDTFAADASPLLIQLQPVERELSSLLGTAKTFTPPFNSFVTNLGPLTTAAKKGFGSVSTELNLTTPLIENVIPVLRNLDPFLQYASEYVPELQSFFANLSSAAQSHDVNKNDPTGPQEHYLRTMLVLNPEGLAVYPQRTGNNRANPYFKQGSFATLGSGLQVFSNGNCANSAPAVSGPANETVSETIIKQIIEFKVANAPEKPNQVGAPGCNQQAPFTFNGQTGQFPHVAPSGK